MFCKLRSFITKHSSQRKATENSSEQKIGKRELSVFKETAKGIIQDLKDKVHERKSKIVMGNMIY